jgi:LAO/AO transport system kinase
MIEEALDRLPAAERHEPFDVARLVSIFQDRRPAALEARAAVVKELRARHEPATVIGVTGTPGSGKSSLLGRVSQELLAQDAELSVAVLAVDPSSHLSGGALLGDRTRLKASFDDPRLYFRSEASDTELGGLSPTSYQVCRLLTLLYDCVFIETVGIGQSEGDVRHLADNVQLVLSPLGGDQVQFLKAGIIEIPQGFIINKCDQPAAEDTYQQLKQSLWLSRPFDADEIPISRISALTGAGIPELAGLFREVIAAGPTVTQDERDAHFLGRWVLDEWGRQGMAALRGEFGGAAGLIESAGGFDAAQTEFNARFTSSTEPT